MSSITVARLAMATILSCPIAGVLAAPATAEPPTRACESNVQIADLVGAIAPLPDSTTALDLVPMPLQEPTTSCGSELDDCMSASVEIGIYGERYVPPDATAACYDAYHACVGQQSEDDGVG